MLGPAFPGGSSLCLLSDFESVVGEKNPSKVMARAGGPHCWNRAAEPEAPGARGLADRGGGLWSLEANRADCRHTRPPWASGAQRKAEEGVLGKEKQVHASKRNGESRN